MQMDLMANRKNKWGSIQSDENILYSTEDCASSWMCEKPLNCMLKKLNLMFCKI